MKLHELKTESNHYVNTVLGLKPYEVRFNDRDFQEGDLILSRSFSDGKYTGSQSLYKIKHILKDFEGLVDGYVILSLNEVIDRSIT